MASRRLTNNSVSTLEEQSEILQSILSKEKISKEKKAHKRKHDLEKKSHKPAALGSARVESNMADDEQSVNSDILPTWSEARALQSGLLSRDEEFHTEEVDRSDYDEESFVQDQDQEMDLDSRPVHDMSEDEQSHVEVEQDLVVEPQPLKKPMEIKKTGVFAGILKKNIEHVKEADKVAPKMSPEVAFGVDKYLKECHYTSDMEKLSKQYHRVENIKSMQVPRLDTEVYQVIDQKIRNNDQSLQLVQKSIVSAISALSPLLELGFERADGDKELDECSQGLWDSIQLMSYALNGISSRRRELIKPSLAPIYARVLTKGHETTPEWLYGGNLLETTKKCEAAKKISEKILKPKVQPQQQKPAGSFRGGRQASRGRGQLRGFNPYQNQRRQTQQHQQQQQSQQYYNTAGDYQQTTKQQYQLPYQQQQQQNQQGFPKNKANNFHK